MKRKQIIVLLIVAAGVIGWALFRPERLFVNAKVNESLPSTASNTTTNVSETTLASGNFHDVAHKGAGQASIYQLADGKRILRFTNFETSNGPDVHVYLVAADDATDSEGVKKAGFVAWSTLAKPVIASFGFSMVSSCSPLITPLALIISFPPCRGIGNLRFF